MCETGKRKIANIGIVEEISVSTRNVVVDTDEE